MVGFLFLRMVVAMLYSCRIISVFFVTFKDLNKTCGVSSTCRKLKMRIFMCEKRTKVALALPTTPVNEWQCALKEGPPAKQSDVSSCTVILPYHRPFRFFFGMHHWQLPFQIKFAACWLILYCNMKNKVREQCIKHVDFERCLKYLWYHVS